MKFPKGPWNVVLWLLAAIVIGFSFKLSPTLPVVQAGAASGEAHSGAASPNASLAVWLPPMLAAPAIPSRTNESDIAPPAAIDLPAVEEFILTPPNLEQKIDQTILALRFAADAAEKLPAAVTTTLGNRQVVFQRSADDPAIYSAPVDFNWNAFREEQARRQVLADEGTVIPIFDGHTLSRTEPMQFVDPQEIRQALQSHQSIRFTPLVLQASPQTIVPMRELLINSINVVEDQTRTWDPCARTGQQMGAWTFGALMTAIANDNPTTHLIADQMAQNWLNEWTVQQNVNQFPVSARLGMLSVIHAWRSLGQDRNGLVDVSQAPFQLNAIVNRIDQTSGSDPSGQIRFVFGYAPCQGGEGVPAAFNVILEFHVPVAQCTWASQWHNLDTLIGSRFNSALQAITNEVTGNAPQNLEQVRTNENFTSELGIWEQRQFALSSGALREVPIPQTPNGDFASGRIDFNQQTCRPGVNCQAATLTQYINQFQQDILSNNYTVPSDYPGGSNAFLGGSAFNGQAVQALVYWQGNPPPASNPARSIFSQNTCNGCHGRETFVKFQQIENRQPGPPATAVPAVLSAFLVGCSTSSQSNPLTNQTGPCPEPPTNACNLQNTLSRTPACISYVQDPGDPSGQTVNQFADISRRAQIMSTILQGCQADGVLQSLAVQRLSSPH